MKNNIMETREIKFRAWDIMRKIWFEQANINGRFAFVNQETMKSHEWHDENIIKVQYTGEKDKNGVEIYEGDIIKIGYDGHTEEEFDEKTEESLGEKTVYASESIDTVDFVDAGFFIEVEHEEYGSTTVGYANHDDYTELEVIGNKYENPELLKQN